MRVLTVGLALVLFAAACGSDGDDDESAAQAETTTQSTGTTEAPTTTATPDTTVPPTTSTIPSAMLRRNSTSALRWRSFSARRNAGMATSS